VEREAAAAEVGDARASPGLEDFAVERWFFPEANSRESAKRVEAALGATAGGGCANPPSGIGNTPGSSMGRNGLDGDGESDSSLAYNRVACQVICRVCPDPRYSDEARKTKLQGSVLLAVLVGADGRVQEVRVIQGLGMGLDENVLEAVRKWQFLPAKDAAQRPVASWIKVESMFRLF